MKQYKHIVIRRAQKFSDLQKMFGDDYECIYCGKRNSFLGEPYPFPCYWPFVTNTDSPVLCIQSPIKIYWWEKWCMNVRCNYNIQKRIKKIHILITSIFITWTLLIIFIIFINKVT